MSIINNFSNNFNKFRLPKKPPVEVLVFPVLGGYHAWNDYKKAPKKDKKDVLAIKLSILAGTSLGAFLGHKGIGKLLETSKYVSTIKKDAIACIGIPLGGIIGGFIAGSITESVYPNIPELKVPKIEAPKLDVIESKIESKIPKKELDPSLKEKLKKAAIVISTLIGAAGGNAVFSSLIKSNDIKQADLTKHSKGALNIVCVGAGAFLGLFTGDSIFENKETELNKKTKSGLDIVLTEASSGVGAFDAVSDKNMKARIQRGFFGIISEVLIPSAVVLPTLYGIRHFTANDKLFDKYCGFMKKISHSRETQKSVFENTISIPLSVITYLTGNWIGEMADKKVAESQNKKSIF